MASIIGTFFHVERLILASTSPFRQALLRSAGVPFIAIGPAVNEEEIFDPTPAALAKKRAEAKANAVAERSPGSLVLGADQVLSFAGGTASKARTSAEARQRLEQLAGQTHWLHSAYAWAWREPGKRPKVLASEVVDVGMHMRTLTSEDIDAYLDTGEWKGSVGCYQYENRGVHLFTHVGGDQSTIIGLPLGPVLSTLRGLGIDLLRQPVGPWQIEVPT